MGDCPSSHGEIHGNQPFFSWETVTDAEPQNPGFRMGQALSIPGIPWAISYICILPMAESMLDKFATSPRSRSLRVHCHEPKLLVNQPPCHDPSADSIVIDWASNPVCYCVNVNTLSQLLTGFLMIFRNTNACVMFLPP